MSHTRDQLIELETIAQSDENINTKLLEQEKDSPEELHIVIHDAKQDRYLIITLIKDFSKIAITRVFSVGCYSAAWQMFIRENKSNLLLSADFSIIGNVSLIVRELFRFITNDTKTAVESGQVKQLQEMFLTANIAAFPATMLAWAITQSYTLTLPLLGRSQAVCEQLQIMPTKFLFNAFLVQTLGTQSNYAYGRGQLVPVLCAFTSGGIVVVSSYMGIRLVNSNLNGFLLANIAQNLTITGCYLGYNQIYHHDERLIQSLFNYHSWLSALKHSFSLMKSGLQPAGILTIEVLSNALATILMRNKTALAAYQSVQIIPFIFTAMTNTLETRIAVQAIEIAKRFKDDPNALASELKRLMLHSAWIGNLFPATFFITAIVLRHQIISLLIKPTEENAAITQLADQELLLVALVPILRMLRSAPYGIVTSFKQSKDIYHQQQNRNATIINSVMAVTSLLIGIGLDYGLEMGSYGYWLGATISLGVSWLGQTTLAMQSIHHEAETAHMHTLELTSEKNPVVSKSWFGFWSSNNNNASSGLLQRAGNAITRTFSMKQ